MEPIDLTPTDLAWLAGLLEGEGTFLLVANVPNRQPRIVLVMTDEDVVARAARLMGTRHAPTPSQRYAERGWKMPYRTSATGRRAVALMELLLPHMGQRRAARITEILAAYSAPPRRSLTDAEAQSISRRYHEGERFPTRLGAEYGISKNLAIYYINKFKPSP